jgi:tetratricopeptide (TPR) repeat protein
MKNLFNKIITLFAVSVLLFGLSRCKGDLLDTSPTYSFSGANVWDSPALARAAVTGVYNGLYGRFTQNYTSGSIGIPSDAWSSVMDIDMNWKNNCFVISGFCTPSDANVSMHYKFYYTIVYRANDAINNIDNVPEMDDSEKARLKAECKFLRAWAYFHLNVLWRGVPVYTENVENTEATKPRSTEAEVWDQVISDLTDCINEPNLPGKYAKGNSSYGCITKGAAYAFRGQAYQFLNDYSKALADFEAIEGLGYALFSPSNGVAGNDDFFQLFKPANEQCDEMIFSIQCVETTDMGNPRGINYGNRVTGGSAWNNYLPNPAFVEMYECADGSTFDWGEYCPRWHSMTPQARVAFFLRDGLQSGNGHWGTTEATSNYKALYDNMVAYGADMSNYLDQGNEARIRRAFEDRDPRLMQAIITPYSTYDGNAAGVGNHTWTLRWPYILDVDEPYDIRTDTNSKFYYLWRKYVPENDECTTRWVYDEDIILCRYAEILFRRAECLNELGRTDEAVTFVNRVRKRAGHVLLNDPAYPATIVTGQDDMRQRIRKEFYVELGGEDSMYFNEIRWSTWYDRKFKDNSSGQTGALNSNGLMQIWGETTYKHLSVGEQIKIWPVPAKEREMNSSLTQNPGWQD